MTLVHSRFDWETATATRTANIHLLALLTRQGNTDKGLRKTLHLTRH